MLQSRRVEELGEKGAPGWEEEHSLGGGALLSPSSVDWDKHQYLLGTTGLVERGRDPFAPMAYNIPDTSASVCLFRRERIHESLGQDWVRMPMLKVSKQLGWSQALGQKDRAGLGPAAST